MSPGCPYTPCQNDVQPGHIFCTDHWAMIPRPLQKQLYRARYKCDHDEPGGPKLFTATISEAVEVIEAAA